MDDKQAFIITIQQNEALIYKVSRIYSNNSEDAQDLYQEIVYQLWKAFPSFRNESKVSTWMYRIALNTSVAHIKKEKRVQRSVAIDDSILNKTESTDNTMNERSALLFLQISKLTEIEKAIILLHLEGNSYAEIATITGFTSSNIGTRLGRIRQKLKDQLNQ